MRFWFAFAACWAVACSHALARPAYVAQPSDALVEVTASPPPGHVEEIPASPAATAVWVDGEWTWRRLRWAWLPGRWVEPGVLRFSPWVFERGADGRLWYAPGTWRDASGKVAPEPPALASAHVPSVEVIDATGASQVTGPLLLPGQAPKRD
jgi:hypothetical protein